MRERTLRREMRHLGVLTGHPVAFAVLALFALGWWLFDRSNFNFGAVGVLATWLMTLFIQRAGHRDTQAVQAKLDELLRAHQNARSELAHLDEKSAKEIEAHRREAQEADPTSTST